MKRIYRINKKEINNSLKYIKRDLIEFPFILIMVILISRYFNGIPWEVSFGLGIKVTIGIYLFTKIIPTLIIHLNHFYSNKDVELEIDKLEEIIKFKKDVEFNYNYSDLKVELHLPVYHKNKNDKMMWPLATSWSNYSFFKIETNDNKVFYISSILIRKEEFPIEPSKINYTVWPAFVKWYEDAHTKLKEEEKRINRWKQKFSTLTIDQINEKLGDPDKYDTIPKKALIELRNEKKATNN